MHKALKSKSIAYLAALSILITGCGSIGLAKDSEFESNYENTFEEPENIYVSSADVMFKSYNSDTGTIDFYVLGTSDIKTLSYDGSTVISDKYGQPLSLAQLQCGDIATIAYNSDAEKVGIISLSDQTFNLGEVSRYTVSENGNEITVGDNTYSIDDNVHIFSDGNEITIDQLINHDGLTIQGDGYDVLSIRVDDGHGYLDLVNEDALIGGWIEIGQTVISQIMPDMLFTVHEGNYRVRLTNTNIEEYRDITISRNNVTELDLSDIVQLAPEKGMVRFNIAPETATTYIDGSFVDTRYAVKLPLGMHQITSQASGYSTVTEFFEVTGLDQTVEMNLEKITAMETASVSNNSIDKNLYANIVISNPIGAEVYEDNIYKGVTPVSYQKTSGTHTLTFRKYGYQTISYTIVVYDDGEDQQYLFPDMVPENGNTSSLSGNNLSSSGSVSGNSVSGNSVSGNFIVNTPVPTPSPTPFWWW